MTLSKYRAFALAAELKSITKTAEKLNYSQSGISHLISSFEEELGVVLLKRGKKGAELTPEGEQILPLVKKLLCTENEIEKKAVSLQGLKSGTLSIAAFSFAVATFLPEMLDGFRAKYPDIKITIYGGNFEEVAEDVKNARADCGLMQLPTKENITAIPLAVDSFVVVLNAKHPLSGEKELAAEQLSGEELILPSEGTKQILMPFLESSGVNINVSMYVRDDYSAIRMVQKNQGITVLPKLLTEDLALDNVVMIPLKKLTREFGVVINKNSAESPLVRAFVEYLSEYVKKRHPAD